ncbi:MAG: CDP-alcohol phosphatidyltransferase family protein [bacterium]|nr:CDP-alcohol phosphatidyltransferase family protein [bacterium]
MLDGKYKKEMDAFWDHLGILFVKLHLTADAVTWIGMFLVIASCLIFFVTRNMLLFFCLLGISVSFDSIDGSVARLTGTSSKYGAYLDAVIDCYQEMLIYFIIAVAYGYWPVCFLAICGSLQIGYNKARTAMEVTVSNNAWPDLLERTEQVLLILIGLLLEALLPEKNLLWYTLILIVVLAHFTAIQRLTTGLSHYNFCSIVSPEGMFSQKTSHMWKGYIEDIENIHDSLESYSKGHRIGKIIMPSYLQGLRKIVDRFEVKPVFIEEAFIAPIFSRPYWDETIYSMAQHRWVKI